MTELETELSLSLREMVVAFRSRGRKEIKPRDVNYMEYTRALKALAKVDKAGATAEAGG